MAAALCPGPLTPDEEEADGLVTHELVDETIVVEDGGRGEAVEAVEEGAEPGGAQPLADARRPADVGEQEAHRDLGAVDPELVQVLDAVAADGRVAGEAREADMPQHGAAGTLEGRRAELAVRPMDGNRRMTRRIRARPGSSPERKPRIASWGVAGRGIARRSYSRADPGQLGPMPASWLRRGRRQVHHEEGPRTRARCPFERRGVPLRGVGLLSHGSGGRALV